MISKVLVIIFFLSISGGLFAQKYVQVWGDEFNTPGLPDSTKWSHEIGKLRNNELQYYTNKRLKNARIEDTVLILEAHKESYKGADYTSGSIRSKGIGDWKYGKFEIRAKVPTGKGTWPAIWMMPTYSEYGGWPRSGEIDIMEYIGVEPQNLYYNAHFEGLNSDGHDSDGSGKVKDIKDPWEKFITYELIWTPEKLEWYADGKKYHEYKKTSENSKTWPFNKEFYLILNLAYGGNWGGYNGIDDSKLPHKFLVDYVRVYQLQDSDGPYQLDIKNTNGGSVMVSPQLDSYPENTVVTITAIPNEDYEFKSWKHFSSANPYTFTIRKNTSITPYFKGIGELLTNGYFDENWNNWNFYVNNTNTISFQPAVENGQFVIDITKSSRTNWHLGFQENGLSMPKGKYKLSFTAYAEQQNSLLITVSKNYADWGSHLSKNVSISTSSKNYELTLNMPVSDENVRLYFGIGNFFGKFYIDNISLTPVVDNTTALTTHNLFENEIKVYPNPSKGYLNIEIPNAILRQNPKLLISNVLGKIVFETKQMQATNAYNLSDLRKGTYFVILETLRNKYHFPFALN